MYEESKLTYEGAAGQGTGPMPGTMKAVESLIPQHDRAAVLGEYGLLGESICILEETVLSLQARLQPVLGPDIPRPADGTISQGGPTSQLSPLAESLRSDSNRVRRLTEQIRVLLDRVEV